MHKNSPRPASGAVLRGAPGTGRPQGRSLQAPTPDVELPLAQLVVGDLVLLPDTRTVTRGGEDIRLTATQFDLLRFLMENRQRVVSKARILDHVWNYDFGGQAHVVELYISYLRKKIDAGRAPMIHTVRGAGYVIRPSE